MKKVSHLLLGFIGGIGLLAVSGVASACDFFKSSCGCNTRCVTVSQGYWAYGRWFPGETVCKRVAPSVAYRCKWMGTKRCDGRWYDVHKVCYKYQY
jgi:hypothetical protein